MCLHISKCEFVSHNCDFVFTCNYDFISCNCDIIFHNCNYYEVTSYLKMWICISVVILFLVITTLYLTMWLYFSNATLFLGINFVFNNCDFCFSQILTLSHSVTLFCFSYFILYLTITFFYSEAEPGFYTLCAILLFAILLVQIKASPPQNGWFLRSQQTSERGLDCSHAAQDSCALCMRLG